jgi:hypothetical protein
MTEEKKSNIDMNSIIRPKSGIELKEEEDRWGLLYDPEKDFSVGLTPVSVFIWKELKGNNSIKDIAAKVRKQFTSVPGEVEADAIEFIESLVENELAFVETV